MRPALVPEKLQDGRRGPTISLGDSGHSVMSAIGKIRNLTITTLFTGLVVIVSFTSTASASAAVRSCSYRNLTYGPTPYVTHITTNLTSAAVDGASVCAVVREVVIRVQLRGYALDAGSQFVAADVYWVLSHHLVYPKGWPQPSGPVYDPHMRVTLRMISLQQTHATVAEAPRTTPYWIKLNEYT